MGSRLREIGLHGRHLLFAEESLEVQVARLLQEGAHLLVGIVWRKAAPDIGVELHVAARVDLASVEGRAQHQPPVQEIRETPFRHVQLSGAHERDGRALVVHDVAELLGRQAHAGRAVVARLDRYAVLMPAERPGFAVGLDAKVVEWKLACAVGDLGLVAIEQRRQGLAEEPAGFYRGLLGVDAGS